jgi:hypothetical protein
MTADTMNDQPASDCVQDSDYDGAWKEALRRFLRAILECYFPAMAAVIAWEHPPEWFDKELSQILGQTGRRNRSVDLLVKMRLRDGSEQWILLHIEIQTHYEAGFAERLALYNSGLFWIFKQRVVSLAVLADMREGWLPDEDRFQLADFESRTRFPVCKLIDRLRTDWQDDHSLPVLLARAQIAALRTAGDPEGRYRAKWQLVRSLYEIGYNAEQVRELFGLIDWMMHLRVDLEKRFKQELDDLEESLQMPFVTSVERIAKAEGRTEGRTEGGAVVLLKQLGKRWGLLDDDIQQQIRCLKFEQLAALGEALLDFRSLQDLEDWLDAQATLDNAPESTDQDH